VFSVRSLQDKMKGLPTAPNMVRLGFHDCMKYEDGTGGCDGCLNWEAMSFRASLDARKMPNARTAKPKWVNGNRGLEASVEYLETVYTTRLKATGRSLKETGKSRADLWAFATIAAIDFTINVNNDACKGRNNRLGVLKTTCLQDSDPLGCEVSLPRPIVFKTGRRDCAASYKASKRENVPSGDLPGPELTKYFKGDFGFNGRESVAIMGAHTLGNFQIPLNGYFYTFTSQQEDAFNNQYFRNIANKDEWFMEPDRKCTKTGTSNYTRGHAKWMMKAQSAWTNKAPVQWIQHKFVCPNCEWVRTNKFPAGYPEFEKRRDRAGCSNVPRGKACKPGAEFWRFIYARDEAGTHADMGMYYDFKVDQDGFPYGCKDLDNGGTAYLKRVTNQNTDHGCGFQRHAEPAGSTPLYKIVEEFADDKDAWLKVFVPTLEKMLSNGYSDLVPSL